MLPVPVELVPLISRSKPLVSQVLHWLLRMLKDRDRLLYKVEALRGSYVLSLKLSKVIAHLPATILGSRHKASLEDMDIVMKERESLLKHIAINVGLCQARARPLVSMSRRMCLGHVRCTSMT